LSLDKLTLFQQNSDLKRLSAGQFNQPILEERTRVGTSDHYGP
jgi:hypothetical protein